MKGENMKFKIVGGGHPSKPRRKEAAG